MVNKKNILAQLKFSYISILDGITEVERNARNKAVLKSKLLSLQEQLYGLFALQRTELYLALLNAEDLTHEQFKYVEFLVEDLKRLKVEALTFFEKHSAVMNDSSLKSVPIDFPGFARDVMTRIKNEETYLIPLIEKYIKDE